LSPSTYQPAEPGIGGFVGRGVGTGVGDGVVGEFVGCVNMNLGEDVIRIKRLATTSN